MEAAITELVSATVLERRGILRKGTAYRMVRAGLLPAYKCGVKGRGVRFKVSEVLEALRQPVVSPNTGGGGEQ
jgi:excisionase family DNA binding protein